MPKDNLREYLDGNELDLSLNNLSVVPVKELSAIPKATHLDLSCNVLTSLPDPFCNLTHLVKIDLSKNQLTSLPTRFGNLTHLQHLDLLGNQLTILPISFFNLQKLKWLDLKDNPLDPGLKQAAGDCLDETQCRKCAKNVLLYMKQVNSEAERRKQKQLQEAREKEAAEKLKEEEELKKKKAEKLAEKERRRKEHQARKAQEKKEKREEEGEKLEEKEVRENGVNKTKETTKEGGCLGRCCFLFFSMMVLLLAIVVGVQYYCSQNEAQQYCKTYYQPAKNFTQQHYRCSRDFVINLLETKFGKTPVTDFMTRSM
ncbi:LOW QUALITY PROTEIN: leucine-rich repeat-containing protein 59-like [Haliotis rubra]|uniref:LOW QUALITY PROTEIN: leucine-rich repeat-containing protein 59-like n=1 Tax=Haliotis rubra TaxID=36100 RepID=UPI001EE572FB|nr:LOW QUALITY PROTEIN: leucine-rich repeat-containing protein 59-like [Haliotis rubra]